MGIDAKEKTALSSSVGTDERQSFQTKSDSSIPTSNTEINYPDENSSENLEELYGISYENKAKHSGRRVTLTLLPSEVSQ